MKPLRILLIAVFLLNCGCASDPMSDPYYRQLVYDGQVWLAQNPGKTWDDYVAMVNQNIANNMRDPAFWAFMNNLNQQRMIGEMQYQNMLLQIGPRPLPYGYGWR